MAKKSPNREQRLIDVYDRLARSSANKVAKTLFLNAENFESLALKCEAANRETEKWNLANQRLPKDKRQPRRKKIKPCDVIDDLINQHLIGEI